MQYALMTYDAFPVYNVGDYIQSLAAAQYLPRVDRYISREKLATYTDAEVRLILNGWFMHKPHLWPPAPQITPLVTSFHLNSQVADQLLNAAGKAWFQQHSPVGCRDLHTLGLMKTAGISAYLSGCLTSTLRNEWNYRTDDIYFVDVLFRIPDLSMIYFSPRQLLNFIRRGGPATRRRILETIVDERILKEAKTLEHYHSARHTQAQRFDMAHAFLEKYATARLVITSRLHCAIPCLAFGTPVIFVEHGFDEEYDRCRISGMTDLFNTITVGRDLSFSSNFPMQGKIGVDTVPPNPGGFKRFVPVLDEACSAFVSGTLQRT